MDRYGERYAVESELAGFLRVYYTLEGAINALPSHLRDQWKTNVFKRTDRGYKTIFEVENPKQKRRWFR